MRKSVIITFLVLCVLAVLVHTKVYSAGVLTYHGRLADKTGRLETGTFCFKFDIYNSSTGGISIWNEEWCHSTERIVISSSKPGVFNVDLGKYNAFPVLDPSVEYYLEVQVSTGTDQYYETLSPRKVIGIAPYARNTQMLGGDLPEHYLDAGNLTGEVSDSLLSTNVLFLNSSPSVAGDWEFAGNVMISTSLDLTGATVTGLSTIETDPVYSAAPASDITNANITNCPFPFFIQTRSDLLPSCFSPSR